MAAFWMEHPLDHLIHAFKYGGRPDLARPLARLMLDALPRPEVDLVVPIPLYRARRRERGYNQAELLARELSVGWGIPMVPDLVIRARATRPQARIAEGERARNLAGAFEVPEPSLVAGRSFLMVDDVVTTGSTALAGMVALQTCQAEQVVCVSLALA